MNAVFGKLVLDRIIAKLVEGRARDKQWRVGAVEMSECVAADKGGNDPTPHFENEGSSADGAIPDEIRGSDGGSRRHSRPIFGFVRVDLFLRSSSVECFMSAETHRKAGTSFWGTTWIVRIEASKSSVF